ncbi:MAG: hypothetical protein CVV64_18590 [Candidatus Wallbacteria bacterium HGW-Wallbacteria-1]|jgi:hypothetical protein|uniref:Uncharacterized protein n=1 Tax=Candidatus Wallbacteria bacterium HGW-Wallbacteria-1 TaxID=2013854 RepID=A0A2N1PJP3_9BACT|nr:MAG: hypothetical protein CVV64_18590 [Candidatus Wallbacteria bacterium HGW-Wallbacteria-1]
MQKELLLLINNDFPPQQTEQIIAELRKVTLNHVMASSEANLFNTRHAILKLANGNIDQVRYYVSSAMKDFRDVIFWAETSENSSNDCTDNKLTRNLPTQNR